MASIEKRRNNDGTLAYRARITLRGHPRLSETFSRLSDARRWAERTESAIRDGRLDPRAPARRHTFGELIVRFVSEKLPSLAERDHVHLKGKLTWWGQQIGRETLLAHVSPATITACKDRLTAGDSLSGRKPSPATVKRYLGILSRAFTVAKKEWFWLDDNPCSSVTRPTEPRGRVRSLDDDERARLLEACEGSSDQRLRPLVVLALATGARQGELLQLRWRDIDLERGVARLEKTKNKERRTLSLQAPAKEALCKLGKVRRLDTDLVFANRSGVATFPRKPWERALREVEIDDFRFHDLRHSAASYLAMSGATLAELAEVLGHKTLAMVKRYSHLTEDHTAKVVQRMNERFLSGA